jgi:nicotinate-nucleotide adenylyltransferase
VRLGILGGSFDPPHLGHLLAAVDAFEALELDRLIFVPAATQPLKVGLQVSPAHHRFFLVGEDALATFASWREPGRILELARLAILRRPAVAGERRLELPPGTIALATRLVEVSSTEIRERVRCGKSLLGFVPEPVAKYIETERLYQ